MILTAVLINHRNHFGNSPKQISFSPNNSRLKHYNADNQRFKGRLKFSVLRFEFSVLGKQG